MIPTFHVKPLWTFPLDHRKEPSQVTAWNHLLLSSVCDMPPCNIRLKLRHKTECFFTFLLFIFLLFLYQSLCFIHRKSNYKKMSQVIYIMTVAGICKCNTDWCHIYTTHFTTSLWYIDEYEDCSKVTERYDWRKKKKKFHVSILICTMQRSKAETEKSRFVQNKGSNDCILLMYFLLPVHTI